MKQSKRSRRTISPSIRISGPSHRLASPHHAVHVSGDGYSLSPAQHRYFIEHSSSGEPQFSSSGTMDTLQGVPAPMTPPPKSIWASLRSLFGKFFPNS